MNTCLRIETKHRDKPQHNTGLRAPNSLTHIPPLLPALGSPPLPITLYLPSNPGRPPLTAANPLTSDPSKFTLPTLTAFGLSSFYLPGRSPALSIIMALSGAKKNNLNSRGLTSTYRLKGGGAR